MDFCSEYGYNYGFEGSDVEDTFENGTPTSGKVRFQIRKADTNIICIKFDDLILPVDMSHKEIVACKRCGAVISNISEKNIENIFDKLLWQCEFCFEENDVTEKLKDVSKLPKNETVTYLVESKTGDEAIRNMLPNLEEDFKNANYLVFCIDVSGSMCTVIKQHDVNDRISNFGSDSECDRKRKLSLRSNSSSSFVHFSDEEDDSNISNIIDENDIIINAKPSDVDMVSEEEKKLDDEIEIVEKNLKDLDVGDERNLLVQQLEELKQKKTVLDEQRTFFEESLRQQDERRTQDLQTQFSLCSVDGVNDISNDENTETKISRLEGVKTACVESLDHLKKNEPHVPVVLVTFSNHVNYYGDSTEPLLVIKDEKDLLDKDSIIAIVKNLKEKIKPVSESCEGLETIIKQLNADGGTALGN
jgi:hypothetical protein